MMKPLFPLQKALSVLAVLALLFSLAGCGASPVSSQPVSGLASQRELPEKSKKDTEDEPEISGDDSGAGEDSPVFHEEDLGELVRVLQDCGFANWAINQMPEDPSLRQEIVYQDSYSTTLMVTSAALWSQGEMKDGEYTDATVTGDQLKMACQDLYGVDFNPSIAYVPMDAAGRYGIMPHGPGHVSELLPDTAAADGDTASIQTRVEYFDPENGVHLTTVMLHTFYKNPGYTLFPYRLASTRRLEYTGSLFSDSVIPPETLFASEKVGRSTVDDLNVRTGPGTEYDKVTSLEQGQLVSFLGEDASGEWFCCSFGWIKAEYVAIVGTMGD